MSGVTWSEFGRNVLLTAPVVAAVLILLGVLLTAAVSLSIARRNRQSLERTAADRMDHDRRQAALDRTYDVRAATFLEALTWLRHLYALTERSTLNSETWEADDWEEEFGFGSEETEALATEVGVYGGAEAERLFREANDHLHAACNKQASVYRERKWAKEYERTGENGHPVERGTVYAVSLGAAYRRIRRAEYDGSDHVGRGFQVTEYFADYCKANLADKPYDIPSERHDASSKAWFAELKQHGGRLAVERYWDPDEPEDQEGDR